MSKRKHSVAAKITAKNGDIAATNSNSRSKRGLAVIRSYMEESSDDSEPEPVTDESLAPQPTSQSKRTKMSVPAERTQPPNAVPTRPNGLSAKEGTTFTCSICKQSFDTVKALTAHTTDHFRVIECTVCQKRLTGDTQYEYHMQNVHSLDVRKTRLATGGSVDSRRCPHCPNLRPFVTDAAYTEHMHAAHPDRCRWYKCMSCPQRFASKPELNVHLYAKHPEVCAQLMACDICGRVCKDEAATALHRQTHTGGQHKDFLCTNCGKGFSRKSNLIFHMRTHSGEQPFECTECGKRFKLSGGLTAHMRTHTCERPYQCPFCEKSYKHSTDLRRHRRTHGLEEMRFGCDRCGKRFYERKFLVTHMRSCQVVRTRLLEIEEVTEEVRPEVRTTLVLDGGVEMDVFEVEVFDAEPEEEAGFEVELDEVEEASDQMVSIEELMLKTGFERSSIKSTADGEDDSSVDGASALATSVDSNIKARETEKPKNAQNAAINSESKSIHEFEKESPEDVTPDETAPASPEDPLITDMRTDASSSSSSSSPAPPASTVDQTFKCSECPRLFAQLAELNAHTAGHFRVIECTLCDKRMTGDTKYEYHMQTVHSLDVRKPRPANSADQRRCQHCPQSKFATDAALIEHMHFAHPDRCHWYKCSGCPERFTSQPELNVHLFAEHPERCANLEACDICGRVCKDVAALDLHRLTHTGGLRKDFLCAYCGRGFARKKNLEFHMVVHSGEQPFQCDECGKRFARSGNLAVHRRTHTKERPFQCPFCERSYAHSTDLRRHRRSHVAVEKRFACGRCGLKFYENKLLVAHANKGCSQIRLSRQQRDIGAATVLNANKAAGGKKRGRRKAANAERDDVNQEMEGDGGCDLDENG